jgi:hypothetical protein
MMTEKHMNCGYFLNAGMGFDESAALAGCHYILCCFEILSSAR